MKKTILLFFILSVSAFKAQSWCYPGAVWYNNFGGGLWGACARQSYTGDTVINNLIYNKIEIFREGVGGMLMGPFYTTQHDRVFMRQSYGVLYINSDTLIPRNSPLGTKWLFPRVQIYRPQCQPVAILSDTGHISVNNLSLKFWVVNFQNSYILATDTFVERIGFLNSYPFFTNSICSGDCFPEFGGRLRCYSDNSFSFNNNYHNTCNFYYTMGVNEVSGQNTIRLFPNPSVSSVNIQNQGRITASYITITDLTGREVFNEQLLETVQETTLDISSLHQGLYMVCFFDNTHRLLKKEKFLVNGKN